MHHSEKKFFKGILFSFFIFSLFMLINFLFTKIISFLVLTLDVIFACFLVFIKSLKKHFCLFFFQYEVNKSYCEDLTEGKFSFPLIHAINSYKDDNQVLSILFLVWTKIKIIISFFFYYYFSCFDKLIFGKDESTIIL